MPQLTSIQQAARNVLATWLLSELASEDITIEPRWAESDRKLPPKRITIIDAGQRTIEWLEPEVIDAVNVGATETDSTWRLGQVEQQVQLDVWAQTDVEIDDIVTRLDASLNKGNQGLGLDNVDLFEPGLRLRLADEWQPGIVDFLFEEPVLLQSPTSVGEGEWRYTYRGRASAQLTQVGRSPRIARVLLNARLYERDSDRGTETDTTVVAPAPDT